ncbi:hypothetical protein FB451DRAFT_1412343 [Mycena latifolia]|nr:hypothetical protein FB451DRAFT_1412343 [Mycena latifolia]
MSPPWTNLAGLSIGASLYGIYFLLYVTSTYVLVRRQSRAHIGPLYKSAVFISGVVLFICVTGNWILSMARVFIGFVTFRDGTAAPAFFDDNSQITTTVQNIFAALSILIADSMIIYRLWIVWSRNKLVVLLPVLTLIGLTIALILTVRTTTQVDDIAQDKGLTPGLVFTLVTNIYSTGLISWKVWNITKASSSVQGNNLRDFISIIIESAAIYTIWAIFYIITHQINSDLQFVALIPLPAVAGIANALIQARIGMGRTIDSRSAPSTSGPTLSSGQAHLRFTAARSGNFNDTVVSRGDIIEMKPVAI